MRTRGVTIVSLCGEIDLAKGINATNSLKIMLDDSSFFQTPF